MTLKITIELTAAQAAGLKRYAEKIGHSDALAVLYGHVSKELRDEQASTIISAFDAVDDALRAQNISAFPWIETGLAE